MRRSSGVGLRTSIIALTVLLDIVDYLLVEWLDCLIDTYLYSVISID
jgi:hypothetical protein